LLEDWPQLPPMRWRMPLVDRVLRGGYWRTRECRVNRESPQATTGRRNLGSGHFFAAH
jgi:hypothetical protein